MDKIKKLRFSKAVSLIALAAAFFLFLFRTAGNSGYRLNPFPETAKVIRVIDGDTVILNTGQKVRYLGMDTPEIRKKINEQWQYMPQPFAEDAKAFNETLVSGKTISLEYDTEKYDKYGRLLAYIRLSDGTFVNEKLIEAGFARTFIIAPNNLYAELFYAKEKEARFEKKGIWGNGNR